MNETLDYIESYFENRMTPEERTVFENRITADESFAQEVAFYLHARQALRQQLLAQKQQQWAEASTENKQEPAPVIQMNRKLTGKRLFAIAASVLVIISASLLVIFHKKDSPQMLAAKYAEQNFAQLSATMDGSRDSLQQGIAAYNRGDFAAAEKLFIGLMATHPEQTDALKYSGLVSLQQKDYDKAISRFQMLTDHTELYANPGLFYQAIALLKRNKGDDVVAAKKLLQTVVENNADGSNEAKEWLKKF